MAVMSVRQGDLQGADNTRQDHLLVTPNIVSSWWGELVVVCWTASLWSQCTLGSNRLSQCWKFKFGGRRSSKTDWKDLWWVTWDHGVTMKFDVLSYFFLFYFLFLYQYTVFIKKLHDVYWDKTVGRYICVSYLTCNQPDFICNLPNNCHFIAF